MWPDSPGSVRVRQWRRWRPLYYLCLLYNHFSPAGVPQQLGQFRCFLSHCVAVLCILKEGFKPFWTQRESNLQKTVKRLHENLFKALAPAACATQTLRESETWSESPQRYCALCAAASSLWAGGTAEWRKAEANCCLNTEGSSTAFMFPVRHGEDMDTFLNVAQENLWHSAVGLMHSRTMQHASICCSTWL